MTKLLYPIYKLPQRTYEKNIPTWIKYWLYTKSFIENVMELSEILTGSEFTLLNTVARKFKIFELGGRTEQATSILPDEYQQVEYIESTGTQYIDTGVKLNTTYRIETEIKWTPNIENRRQLFGVNAGTYYWGINRDYKYECGTANVGVVTASTDKFDKLIITREINKETINVNGIDDANRIESVTADLIHTLFGLYLNTGYQCYCTMKYYKIFNNNIIVRDFIPCYRKSDNEIGLYDLVTNTFFTNQGTGTFLKGNDIISLPTLEFEIPIKNVTGNVNVNIQNEDGIQEQNYPFTFEEGQRLMEDGSLQDNGINNKRKQKILLNPPATNANNSTILSVYWLVNYCPNFNLDTFKKCSHFKEIKKWSASLISEGKTCLWAHEGITFGIIFNKQETGVTTLSEAKTFLAEHNIIVEWELAEEEIIPYNETQQAQYNAIKNAKTYKDITYIIGSSSELAPNLTIQYWKKKGGERSMKLSKDDLKKKLDERIEDEDLKIELLEDVEDSFEEVVEDTVERVEKSMYDELETKYDELKTKYKERFFKTEDETVTEEKEDETGLTEETVYEKEDIFEETKKEED